MIKRLTLIIFLIFSLSFIGCSFNDKNTTADELISPSLSAESKNMQTEEYLLR